MLPYSEKILSENMDDAGVHRCFKAISFNRGNHSSCIQAFNGQHFLSTSGSEINFFISFLIKISFDFFSTFPFLEGIVFSDVAFIISLKHDSSESSSFSVFTENFNCGDSFT